MYEKKLIALKFYLFTKESSAVDGQKHRSNYQCTSENQCEETHFQLLIQNISFWCGYVMYSMIALNVFWIERIGMSAFIGYRIGYRLLLSITRGVFAYASDIEKIWKCFCCFNIQLRHIEIELHSTVNTTLVNWRSQVREANFSALREELFHLAKEGVNMSRKVAHSVMGYNLTKYHKLNSKERSLHVWGCPDQTAYPIKLILKSVLSFNTPNRMFGSWFLAPRTKYWDNPIFWLDRNTFPTLGALGTTQMNLDFACSMLKM